MITTPTLRPATAADVPRLLQLLTQISLLHHEARPDLFGIGQKYDASELLALINDPMHWVFVADVPGMPVAGYAICQQQDPEASRVLCPVRTFYLDDLCVDRACQGQGVGTALMQAVRQEAVRRHCHHLTLHVWQGNDSARTFYEAGPAPHVHRNGVPALTRRVLACFHIYNKECCRTL